MPQVVQNSCGVSLLEDSLKPSRHGLGQLALGGPVSAGRLTKRHRGALQPLPFCDCAV